MKIFFIMNKLDKHDNSKKICKNPEQMRYSFSKYGTCFQAFKDKIHLATKKSDKKVKITTGKEIVYGEGFSSNPDFTEYKIAKIHGSFDFKAETN